MPPFSVRHYNTFLAVAHEIREVLMGTRRPLRQGRVVQISGAHRKELHLYPKITKPCFVNLSSDEAVEAAIGRQTKSVFLI